MRSLKRRHEKLIGVSAFLASAGHGLKLNLGRCAWTHSLGNLRLDYPHLDYPGWPNRRVLLQVVARMLDDGPVRGISIHLGSSPALGGLREIGGPLGGDGLPPEEFLGEQPIEWITYFAVGRVVSGPGGRKWVGGVLRRREISGRLSTEHEVFTRRLRWQPTARVPTELSPEISEGVAVQFVVNRLYRMLPVHTYMPG